MRCVRAPVHPQAVGRLADHRISVGWSVVPGHCTVLHGQLAGMTLEHLAPVLGGVDRESRRALGDAALAALADAATHAATDAAGAPLPGPLLHERDGGTYLGPLAAGLTPGTVWACAVDQLADRADAAIGLIDAEVGPHRDVVLTGGWLRNPAVVAAKRARYGTAIRSPDAVDEAGAVGAAFLSGVAAGLLERPPHDTVPQWHEIRHGEDDR